LHHYAGISPNPDKVLFDIGANKGYDLGLYYSLWTNWTKNIIWQHTKLHPGCPWYMDTDRVVFPRVFAFEPSPSTYASLQDLAEQLPFCGLSLENVAMSNKAGSASFSLAPAGDEGAKILNADEIAAYHAKTVEVKVSTFDDYVRAHEYVLASVSLCHCSDDSMDEIIV
jgi:FkbM family methyltransferase